MVLIIEVKVSDKNLKQKKEQFFLSEN